LRLYLVASKPTDSVIRGILPAAARLGLDVVLLTDKTAEHVRAGVEATSIRILDCEEYLAGGLRTMETLGDGVTTWVLGGFRTRLSPLPFFIEERLTWADGALVCGILATAVRGDALLDGLLLADESSYAHADRLLVKDFDGALVHLPRLAAALGSQAPDGSAFADPRPVTHSDDALADVFITITVHLCAGALAFGLADRGVAPLPDLLALVRRKLISALDSHGDWPAASVLRARAGHRGVQR
jgi:hypothetical protein